MSKIAVNEITDEAGTGAPTLPNGLGVTGDIDVSGKLTNGGVVGIQIDASGRVITPNQVTFRVFRDSPNTSTNSNDDVVPYNAKDYDIGNNYNLSTLRFNAPVSGVYLFVAHINCYGMSSGEDFRGFLRINGSDYTNGNMFYSQNSGDHVVVVSDVLKLEFGDYVDVVSRSGDASRGYSGSGTGFWNSFAGYLIG